MTDHNKQGFQRKMLIGTWSTPYDPQTYSVIKLDITKVVPYLEKKSIEMGEHLTPTTYMVKLMSLVFKKFPEVNGQIRFGHYEEKDGVDVCCLVEVGGGKELANVTIYNCDSKDFKLITQELKASVKELKTYKEKSHNMQMNLYKLVPTFIMGVVIQVTSWIVAIGFELKQLGLKRYQFGSCVVTSVGSLGIEDSSAPIPPCTFSPFLLTVCLKYQKNIRKKNGEIETRTYLRINTTSDYRYFNLDIGKRISEEIHRIGENPDIFEEECKKYEGEAKLKKLMKSN